MEKDGRAVIKGRLPMNIHSIRVSVNSWKMPVFRWTDCWQERGRMVWKLNPGFCVNPYLQVFSVPVYCLRQSAFKIIFRMISQQPFCL